MFEHFQSTNDLHSLYKNCTVFLIYFKPEF
jgi:hypothetical protein